MYSVFIIVDPSQAVNSNHMDSISEGLSEPETKTFYENLPFHGIQSPPNKVRGEKHIFNLINNFLNGVHANLKIIYIFAWNNDLNHYVDIYLLLFGVIMYSHKLAFFRYNDEQKMRKI